MDSNRSAKVGQKGNRKSGSSSTVGLSKFPVDSHLRRRESVLALGFQSIGKVIPTPDPPS